MPQNIPVSGMVTTAPDRNIKDGASHVAVNLEAAPGGGMQPIGLPSVAMSIPFKEGENTHGEQDQFSRALVGIHSTADYTHYIIADVDQADNDRGLYWVDKETARLPDIATDDLHPLTPPDKYSECVKLHAVGNTLVMLYDDTEKNRRLHYWLLETRREKDGGTAINPQYKSVKGYKSLGEHMPEAHLRFSLDREILRGFKGNPFNGSKKEYEAGELDVFSAGGIGIERSKFYEKGGMDVPDKNGDTTQSWQYRLTQEVMAKVNKWIKERVTDENRFVHPFLVRYAYRLYDGSLTMHSAPILMLPNSGAGPVVSNVDGGDDHPYYKTDDDKITSMWLGIWGAACRLYYRGTLPLDDYHNKVKPWMDIIKSIDVFVSLPLARYDQEGKVEMLKKNNDEYTVSSDKGVDAMLSKNKCQNLRTLYVHEYTTAQTKIDYTYNLGDVVLPAISDGEWLDNVRSCAQFYLVASLPLGSLMGESLPEKVPMEKGTLATLATRELMTDDYDSHDILMAGDMFTYNSRVNLSAIRKRLFPGFDASALLQKTSDDTGSRLYVYFKRTDGSGEEVITSGGTWTGMAAPQTGGPVCYLYHPDKDVTKAVVVAENGNGDISIKEHEMKSHDFLNGSFWCCLPEDFSADWTNAAIPYTPPESTEIIRAYPNKVYTSEALNPYIFPLGGINTIGTGEILGICSAVRPLSQGQFGAFPLYCFASDGIWALSVGEEGNYTARQPITRDVCVNPWSIAQMDTGVLFATDRGLMIIEGAQTRIISDTIYDPSRSLRTIEDVRLPGWDRLLTWYGLTADQMPPSPAELLKSGHVAYDYRNSRILLYDSSHTYIYSISSGEWGYTPLMALGMPVNAYPDAWCNDASLNKVYDIGRPSAGELQTLWLSRPIKLDDMDLLKTIRRAVVRGDIPTGATSIALWGTRDGRAWRLVGSDLRGDLRRISGTGYRAFRIAIAGKLLQDCHLSHIELEVLGKLRK